MIRARTQLTISASGTAPVVNFSTSGITWSAADVENVVRVELTPYVRVYTLTLQYSPWDLGSWSYRATITCETLFDHASPDDVVAIVRHAFFQATGNFPDVTIPVPLGQPAQPQLPDNSILPDITGPGLTASLAIILAVGIVAFVFANKVT